MISDELVKKVTGQYDLELIQRLNLDNFGLKSVGNLSRMSALRELSVSRNDISDLSPLTDLGELRGLNVSDNIIRNIDPLVQGALAENLEVLDLSGNHRLESLAKVIAVLKQLPSLRRLTLKSSSSIGGAPITDFQQDLANPGKYPQMIFDELPNVQILDGSHVMVMKVALGSSSPKKSPNKCGADGISEEEKHDEESSSWVDLVTFNTEGIMDYSPRKNAVLGSIEDHKRAANELLRRSDQALLSS